VSITALTVLGHTVLGFEQAYLTPVVGVAAALGTEILLDSVDAFAHHRRPKYLGRGALDFLLPAYIAGLACAMLLYANDLLMPTVLAAVVGVASKYVVRIPVGRDCGTCSTRVTPVSSRCCCCFPGSASRRRTSSPSGSPGGGRGRARVAAGRRHDAQREAHRPRPADPGLGGRFSSRRP